MTSTFIKKIVYLSKSNMCSAQEQELQAILAQIEKKKKSAYLS